MKINKNLRISDICSTFARLLYLLGRFVVSLDWYSGEMKKEMFKAAKDNYTQLNYL